MNIEQFENNPYLLLTPGPLSTSKRVKAAMLKDWCTWDNEYNELVQEIRSRLVALATKRTGRYTTVLMQGSGSFAVEAVIGTVIPKNGKLLVIANGAYGQRIARMAEVLNIDAAVLTFAEDAAIDLSRVEAALEQDPAITHAAVVHCETTSGMLNPIADIGRIAKRRGLVYIVDAMSSFGGIPMELNELAIDYLISSANKCIQGVPGFGFVIADKERLQQCAGQARSLSLDLYDQWKQMEDHNGKWRFTSPTHVVRAFYEAMRELEEEGGVARRNARYAENQRTLSEGMRALGFRTLLPDGLQSPIITSFLYPENGSFRFKAFYEKLKAKGFVIYPGKISHADTFRIGNIGEVNREDMVRLLAAIGEEMQRPAQYE
ncbi:2-aminoethylphosphonate--pyruvate transaminase [Paenibacillus lycopersici]|uniref:2-aminoethylphosphonate--pyruvate transaminase n=1 Tax=Paenibacillus lycopersici TaxID=2704462 RepID=A0A6C0FSW9_9BACL|nr:2-aminoethylphosphonate--pyruvate transaminase [Paenibacillus lycopersici]QHT58551.1 2-aminoethylphosphonate--pyruvate transaminase [Paenibacillus lycopersici]